MLQRNFEMKKILTVLCFASVFSCSKSELSILGMWKVDSKYYKATCEILEEDGTLKGRVLYYNDGTTVYRNSNGDSIKYFFSNLKENEGVYIDAVSGATSTKSLENSTTSLKLLSKDTLEVISYIMHKPLKENWIRIKSKM